VRARVVVQLFYKRTYDVGVQADQVLIYWVLSEKSALKCSFFFQQYYALYITRGLINIQSFIIYTKKQISNKK